MCSDCNACMRKVVRSSPPPLSPLHCHKKLGRFMSHGSISLEEIATRQKECLAAQGISNKPRTAEIALLQLVAHVGELASVVHRPTPLTHFERDEVGSVLASLILGVVTIGDVFGVNISESVVQCVNQQMTRVDFRAQSGGAKESGERRCAPPHPQEETAAGWTNDAPHAVVQENDQKHILLSPASRRNFFPTLDVVTKFSREAFEDLSLTWTAPKVDGELVELIAGGKHKHLSFDDLPEYLKLVEHLRLEHKILQDAPPALQNLPSSVAAASGASGVVVKHVDVPAPPGYNADQVKTLFSPTHFDHGLFSPHSVAKGFDVPYPTEEGDHSPAASPDTAWKAPTTQKEFFALVDDISQNKVAGDAIASLQLTFAMPIDQGRVIEFIPNGAQVPVTAANAQEFVRQAYESLRNHHQGKVRRTESIKRLQAANPGPQYDPSADKDKFSPTHFSHNIFAPYSERTKFYVDYDPSREEDCLPEALRAPKPSSVQEYQEYLRTRGAEGFKGVVQQIERKPSDIKRFGVTWCVPRAVQPSAFPDGDDDLHDLLPNGRDLPVEEEFITVFLGMAHKYM